MKPARLIEDQIPYDHLLVNNKFSHHQKTLTTEITKKLEHKKLKQLGEAVGLQEQIRNLSNFSIDAMEMIVNGIENTDEQS